MGNLPKAKARDESRIKLAKAYEFMTRVDDKTFDEWLFAVVKERADTGSPRAQEMLDTEAASHD